MRTLVVALIAAPILLYPRPLSATDLRPTYMHTCNEDQVAVWSGRTHAHTRCLDIDDARTARILHRKGLPR